MGVRGVKRHIKEILITSLSHHSQPSKDTLTITITMPKVSSVYINTVHHFHSILPRVGMLCFCKTLHASRETRQGYLRAVRFGSPSPRAPHLLELHSDLRKCLNDYSNEHILQPEHRLNVCDKHLNDYSNEHILQPKCRLNISKNISMITVTNTFCTQNIG